jgi:hypothetical protein
LIREGFKEFDLGRRERPYLGSTRSQNPNEFPLLTKGNGQEGAGDAGAAQHWEIILRAGIRNVERAMIAHPVMVWLINTDLDAADGYGAKMSPQNHSVPLVESQHHVIDPANPGRALDDGVENRLHVCRRAADDTEHLGGCGLMLQSFPQFSVALAEFPEESHVLDGDYGLVSEGLE